MLRPRADPGRRLGATLLCIAVVMSLFAGRLIQLQGFESGTYVQIAQDQRLETVSLPAVRGDITAANGQALAITVQTYLVYADPVMMTAAQMTQIAADLAGPLGMGQADILSLLQHPTSPQYVVLKSGGVAGDRRSDQGPVAARRGRHRGRHRHRYDHRTGSGLPGIQMQASYKRVYPDGDVTSNLLGFTHTTTSGNLSGVAGLEYSDNALLAGKTGSEQFQFGYNGQQIPLAANKNTPAVNGSGLRLTIIPALQWEAQQACQQEVQKSHADNCTVVVMQPGTGKILAMAQWPAYDPASSNPEATSNLAVQNIFEPGSTAKVITAAAAMEKGGQTITSTYTVPDVIDEGGFTFHDAEYHPVERWTIAGILAHSSNDGMVQVVRHVPPQTQYDYLKAFGLDEPTGLNLPGETPGLLPAPSAWWGNERYTLSFGQGVDVNALQMASVYATIANGGVRVQPTLVAGTTSARHLHPGRRAHVPAGHPGQHGPEPDRGAAAGTRGRPGGRPAVGRHPRLRGRREDRHVPGVGRHPQVPVQVRIQLDRDGARRQPPARGVGQRAEPHEERLLRCRRGRAGLLSGDEVRPADHEDSAGRGQACGRAAHRALIGGNLCACPWPSVPPELCAAPSPAWARCSA